MLVVIGSYSQAADPGIHLYRMKDCGESLSPAHHISGIENPSYLTLAREKCAVYAITENKESSASWLHIYEVSLDGLAVRHTGSIPFNGAGSCYISTDALSRHAFIANYGEGTLTVISLPATHRPGHIVQQLSFSGSGPEPKRQDQPHLHAALLSPDEQHLLCADLGTDRLYNFRYRPYTEPPLDVAEPAFLVLPPGSGPRQIAFSPNGQRMYVVTELSGEIFVFDIDRLDQGWLQRVSLVQEGYHGKIEGGDIQVDAAGRFLYASNRGDANEIVVFAIEPMSGLLDFRQRKGAAGLSPRSILLTRKSGLLLVANEQSDTVSIFSINENGTLEFTRNYLQVPSPTCLKLMEDDYLKTDINDAYER